MTGDTTAAREPVASGTDHAAPQIGLPATGARAIGPQALMNVASAALAGAYTIWLTSFLLGLLGSSAYGTWATVTAILTPLLVLDAGLGLLVIRATAAHGTGKAGASVEAMTAHGLYLGLGLIGLVLGLALGLLPGPLLGLSGADAQQARLTAWTLALDFGLIIGTSALPGLLRGRRRYDAIFVASLLQILAAVALTLVLVPSMGLVGAAVAQLVSHGIGRLVQFVLVRRLVPWFSPRPHVPQWAYLRSVVRFSAPLIVISLASQISFSTDVIVVGAVAGAAAASSIAVGARLPILAVSLLSIATDVLFPVFVEEERLRPDRPPALLRRALFAAGLMGGCAFLFLASARTEILAIWVPGVDPIAGTVFAIYCATWAIHTPAHVLALVIVSRARHAVLAPLVFIESIVNLLLSIALVLLIGPVGAAVGSFIAVGVSNVVVLPLVMRFRLGIGAGRIVAVSAAGLAAGALIAAVGWSIVEVAGLAGPLRLVVQSVVTGVLGCLGLLAAWGGRQTLARARVLDPRS